MKKHILSILIAIIMVVSMMPTALGATTKVKLSVEASSTTANADEEITFTLYIQTFEDGTVSGFELPINVPTGLTYVPNSGKVSDTFKSTANAEQFEWIENGTKFFCSSSEDDGLAGLSTKQAIGTFRCKVDSSATGSYSIGVSVTAVEDKDVVNIKDKDYFTNTLATITIQSTPTHDHSWSDEWSSDATYHWHECTATGCNVTENSSKDGYETHTPGAAANETTPQTCTKCGYEMAPATGHIHDNPLDHHDRVEPKCTTDGNIEYWSCSRCSTLFKNSTGTETVENVTLSATGHSPAAAWTADETGHWHACQNADCSEKLSSASHSYSHSVATDFYKKSNATCTSPAVYYKSCECGRNSTTETFTSGDKNLSSHTGTLGGWKNDTNKHWKEYSCCQAHQEEAAHNYTDAQDTTCNTCGYERTVTPPPVDKVLESIEVTTNPTKMVYTVDENFDSTGMVVTARYSDQTSAVVTNYSVSGGNPFAAGDASVTISYAENGVTKEVVLQLTVNQQGGEPEVGVKVTFDANGGVFANQTTSKTIALDDWHESPVPTRSNYSFDGWYTERVGGSKVEEPQRYNESTTLYAHWTYIGGDGSITIITHPDNDTTGTKENPGTGAAPSSIGYVFVGLAAVGALCFGAKKLIKKEEE